MAINIYGKLTNKHIAKDVQVIDKKIYGLNFPFKNNNRGYFSKSQGVELTRNNLRQLLLTERGERVMLPNYGVSLKKYLFDPLDQTTFQAIQSEILTSISNYLPTVNILKLSVVSTEDVGFSGIPGLIITLVAELFEAEGNLIELSVKIG